jgi:hypothetical protein
MRIEPFLEDINQLGSGISVASFNEAVILLVVIGSE